MNHVIRQQQLHVQVNGTESDGLALQRRLPDVCARVVQPVLERMLDQYAPSEGHVYVDRLEIDAGTLMLEKLESDLPAAIARAIERALREQLPLVGAPPVSVSGNVRYKTSSHSIHEAFLSFLTTGSLPWWFRLPAGKSLEDAILGSWSDEAESGTAHRSTLEGVRRVLDSPPVRERLIRQFSRLFLETILRRLSLETAAILVTILETLRNSGIPQENLREFEKRLWERVLATIPAGLAPSPRSLIGEAWASYSGEGDQQAGLGHALEQHWPGVTNKAPTGGALAHHPTFPYVPKPQHPMIDRVEGVNKMASINPTPLDRVEQPEAREGLYIDNAGLVLLHPFLSRLFSSLGISADDTLALPERALCLLHYLATGQTVAPEYALVLPKILCHLPLEWPAESDVGLSVAERDEAHVLLESAIRHWEALRNTSPDGLRGTFLMRPGKVVMREDGDWVLQVEANTADILLDQLPWGISMIKLPWMSTMLWVEWR